MAGNHKNGGIKGLALAHCEKLVAALAIGAAAYFAWASTSIEKLERDPSQLSSLVTNTGRSYVESTWDNSPEEDRPIALPVPSPRIGGETDLKKALVRPGLAVSEPVLPPIVDREDPQLLPPTDLEGTATTGIFAFIDPERRRELELIRVAEEQERQREREKAREEGGDLTQALNDRTATRDEKGRKIRPVSGRASQAGVATTGDERFERLSAVCVLAKAPVLDQETLYRSALLDAQGYDPQRDIPRYYGLYAQRVEVRGDEEVDWDKAVDVRFGNLTKPLASRKKLFYTTRHNKMVRDWLAWPQPIVAGRFTHPILTMPLAPLVKQNWGPETIHSDTLTEAEDQAREAREQELEATELENESESEEDEFGEFAARGRAGARAGYGGGTFADEGGGYGGGGGYGAGGGGYGGGGYGGGGYGAGGGGYGGGGYGGGGGGGNLGVSGEYVIDPETPFAMIRFWDFGVAPGRQYQYRIKLVLYDVNSAAEVKQYLSREVRERVDASTRPVIKTEWSEPGPVVSVPLEGDAFIVDAKAAGRGAYSDGEIELLVQSYSLDDGKAIKAAVKKKFRRGSVLNFEEDAEFLSPDGRNIVEADDFAFQTGLTVADFRGGDDLPGRLKKPISTLMMDATGKLFVRHALEDFSEVRTHDEIFEDSEGDNSFRGGGDAGDYGGYGGYE